MLVSFMSFGLKINPTKVSLVLESFMYTQVLVSFEETSDSTSFCADALSGAATQTA